MATKGKVSTRKGATTANLGFEAKLWAAADALRDRLLTGTAKFAGWAAA